MSKLNAPQADEWPLLATACEMLAFSLRYPTMELAAAVSSGEWADAAREISAALGLALPEVCLEAAAADRGRDAEGFMHDLRIEATHLFIGAPDPLVSPYEGIWRAEDEGVQALQFVNPHSMDVERFCKSCGLGRPEGTNEPLDNAATELELLQYLASLEAGIAAPVPAGPAPEGLPGGSAAAAFGLFMAEHPLTWMDRFASDLADGARQPFYRATGALLGAFLGRFKAEA